MQNVKLYILIVSIGIFGFACQKSRPIPSSNIKGIVKYINEIPIAGAIITLDSTISTIAGKDGTFAFMNVKPMLHQVSVTKPAYTTIQQTVNLIADETQNLTFILDIQKLTVTTNKMTVPYTADSAKIQITSNVNWSTTSNAPLWLVCVPDSESANINTPLINRSSCGRHDPT
jgi:hypothetical protein